MKKQMLFAAAASAAFCFAESAKPAAAAPAAAPALHSRARAGRLPRTGALRVRPYGKCSAGEAKIYRLQGAGGLVADFTDYGARLVRLYAPDRHGNLADVTLGFNAAGDYDAYNRCMGTSIGRFGNRIAAGRFTLDGQECKLPLNNDPAGVKCCLHGGAEGWDRRIWKVKPVRRPRQTGLAFTLESPDGDEGFPGRVMARVTHWITADNVWTIEYEARTDKKTVVNLTNHAYFNLAGAGDTLGQTLEICADEYTEVTPGLIPVKNAPVKGTPFDFTAPRAIGAALGEAAKNAQLKCGSGWYDHNFVVRGWKPGANTLNKAAVMADPKSGRTLEVWTTEPGVQFYGGQGLDKQPTPGKRPGEILPKYAGIALETQHFPDSPNRPDFPSTVLEPGQVYSSRTEYRFGAR